MRSRKLCSILVAAILMTGVCWMLGIGHAADSATIVNKDSLKRARKTVRMLDDVHKTAVVLITTHYVNDDDDLAAGTAAKALFGAMKEKGWYETKILDVTGEPYEETNVAKSDFEKKAAKEIKSGKVYYDEVTEEEGKQYLLAATSIPVVLKKCIMCHPNYEDVKKGAAIGMLTYKLELD